MKKFFFFIVLVALSNNSSAQNLIKNGSFEEYTSIPNSSGQFIAAKGWKSAGGSPDYFHEFASVISGVNIPFTFAGAISKAHEGLACAGICSYMQGWVDFREYLAHKITTPLVMGQTYEVNLWVLSNTNPLYYGGLASDNFGVAFSTQKLKKSADGVVHVTPQCLISGQLYSYSWKKLSFELYADSAYKYITIGNFVNDNLQNRQLVDTALLFSCVYTFIDDVSVELKNSTTTTAVDEHQYSKDGQTTYTDILGRPVAYRKGLLIAKHGNKFEKIYVK